MPKRREFPRAVRVAVIKRATKDGKIICESCGAMTKRFQIDHIRADGLLGDPTIKNAMLICEACWKEKNPADTRAIAEAKRREASHIGAEKPGKQKIPQRPGPEKKPPRELAPGVSNIARRYGIKQEKKDGA